MFQFPRLASLTYVFSQGLPGFARQGFPIRKSTDKLAIKQPVAYRRQLRPSSPLGAKASTTRPY